ncbi:Bifunctional hemolysin/adenylate cyclase [compost metagenome]
MGQLLRVVASFTDDQGFANQVASAATSGVGALVVGTAGNDVLSGTAFSDQIQGLDGNDILNGLAGDDILDGGAGIDTLRGGLGADRMLGGLGNDVYEVNHTGDTVVELVGEGSDTVWTSLLNYTLTENVENLVYSGSGNFTGTGNALANSIMGGVGNDVLSSGDGNDVLQGSAGIDTLRGGLGADMMLGGLGNDVYEVNHTGDTVVEFAGEGADTVWTSLLNYTLTANVENLVYSGSGNFTGTGNALANSIMGGVGNDVLSSGDGNDVLQGSAGIDTLRGGLGADMMLGGLGNDVYEVNHTGDTVVEFAGEGADTVWTSLLNYTLTANVETLVYSGSGNFTGTGNALANSIMGGVGSDTLRGGAGNDILIGGLGNDTFVFGAGFGQDRVMDFDANPVGGQDRIDIAGMGITAATFAANVAITDVGADTRVAIGANSITLVGVADATSVTQTDFTLAV